MIRLAILEKDSPRGVCWDKLFLGRRVPVTNNMPAPTILPNGEQALCYFVDFEAMPAEQRENLVACISRSQPQIRAMFRHGIYPLRAEGVTVVESSESLWAPSSMQPPG